MIKFLPIENIVLGLLAFSLQVGLLYNTAVHLTYTIKN